MVVTPATRLDDALTELAKALGDRWKGFAVADLRLVWDDIEGGNTPGELVDAKGAVLDQDFVEHCRQNFKSNLPLLRMLAARG